MVPGKLYKTDETLQSGWTELSNISKTTILSGSESSVYGVDANQHLVFCSGENCDPVDTAGHAPTSLSSVKNELWMTTQDSSENGNIFWKVETPDYSSIMNTITPLDKRRSEIVQDIQQQQKQQDILSQIQDQITQIKNFMTKVLDSLGAKKEQSDLDIKSLQKDIQDSQASYTSLSSIEPLLQKLFFTVLAVGLLYLAVRVFRPACSHSRSCNSWSWFLSFHNIMEGPVAPPKKLPSFEESVKTKTGPDKESKARDEAEKVIRTYTQQYETLKLPKQKPSQENKELREEVAKEKSQTDALNRVVETSGNSTTDWLGIVLDVLIAILGLVVAYLLFSRLFTGTSSAIEEVVAESSDVTI
jgi:hypothetical protein